MKNCKLLAGANALAGTIVLFCTNAHAQPFCETFSNNFNNASGSCDSQFTGGCSLDGYFTGGRAGFNTVSGNGFLWISHDQSWNSWNVETNPGLFGANGSSVSISASIFSTDSAQIGELDVWEVLGNGNLNPLCLGFPIFGTNGVWTNSNIGECNTSQATTDRNNVLIVFGRHQGEGSQENIAVDNVSVQQCNWSQ